MLDQGHAILAPLKGDGPNKVNTVREIATYFYYDFSVFNILLYLQPDVSKEVESFVVLLWFI